MRDQQEHASDNTHNERHVVIDHVEILDPEETPEEITPQELLALLVAHFEESLIRKEHELIALRRSLEDAERAAAEVQHALQQELETANQVSRILERENQRLNAEIEALRSQTDSQRTRNDPFWRTQELERENRRLLAEIDAFRRQAPRSSSFDVADTPDISAPCPGAGATVSHLSAHTTDDILLETLLTCEPGAALVEPPCNTTQARRFRKRASAL